MKKFNDTWTIGLPDFIESYRYVEVKPSYQITDYSTRERHNIQAIFNKDSDGNLRIATAYPDIDVDLGSAIPLDQVRQNYESLMSNGSASDSVSRNQVYQNALTEFKKALLWANDNSTGSLTNIAKKMIEQYNSLISNSKTRVIIDKNNPTNKMPKIELLDSLSTIFEKLDKVIY